MATFIQLKPGFVPQPNQKVIPAADWRLLLEGHQLIEAAREEAEQLKADARERYQQEKRRGYEEGFREGKLAVAGQMMETVARTVDYIASAEERTFKTVKLALEKILGKLDQDLLIRAVVKEVLTLARNQDQVTLRVCPEQENQVREHLDEILAHHPTISLVQVTPDRRLSRGGCILETEIGVVDAGLDVQLETITKAMRKQLRPLGAAS